MREELCVGPRSDPPLSLLFQILGNMENSNCIGIINMGRSMGKDIYMSIITQSLSAKISPVQALLCPSADA